MTRQLVAALLAAVAVFAAGCKKKATPEECDRLLDRFATLVVKEKHPDAGAASLLAEQKREREDAKRDEAFRNCTSEVSKRELDCAMAATTTEAMLKCLE